MVSLVPSFKTLVNEPSVNRLIWNVEGLKYPRTSKLAELPTGSEIGCGKSVLFVGAI